MADTLILLFHPDLAHSRANAAFAAAAGELPGIEIVDMYRAYPDGIDMARDGGHEAARLLAADRLVLQFPLQWYSTPPLLKAWQDAVLTRMFYIEAEREGQLLAERPFMLAVTAGNMPGAYTPSGSNGFPLDEILTPLKATAHRCRLRWERPHLLYMANKLDEPALAQAASDYADHLRSWIAETVAPAPVEA